MPASDTPTFPMNDIATVLLQEPAQPETARAIHFQESVPSDDAGNGAPQSGEPDQQIELDERTRTWLNETAFKGAPGSHVLIPDASGTAIDRVVFGLGGPDTGRPCGPGELLMGNLPKKLPPGTYRLQNSSQHEKLAAIAWGLGAYRFERYKDKAKNGPAQLQIPDGVDADEVETIASSIWLGRDLINTPAADLGPEELEDAARHIAGDYGARTNVIVGDALLSENFPMIHAVGRASPRAPRLIELNWEPESTNAKTKSVTLVGKGICFDTGGLDLKPASNMILMKKDMGGAASALALARIIMGCKANIRLRVLIPAAENNVDGNAFRPSDILTSRSGQTVEIGNTDAEGRLVLADALSYACETPPDFLISLATLTGAARVALGPDLPALFCTNDEFSAKLVTTGQQIGDPLWPLPFWKDYDRTLNTPVADMCNIANNPLGGAITAALFLKRFVKNTQTYAHIDMYGWRASDSPLGPKGGESHAARTLFEALRQET